MLAFFAFSAGCGGSSSSDNSSSDNPSGSAPAKNSGTVIGKVVRLGFDDDNDNKPDVLDFDGVQQLYINTAGDSASGTVPFMVLSATPTKTLRKATLRLTAWPSSIRSCTTPKAKTVTIPVL